MFQRSFWCEVLFEELEETYRKHRQGLFTLALSVTGCPELAEDAVQSAFERLCRRRSSPQGSVTSYVFASVRNAALDVRRKLQRSGKTMESIFNGTAADSTPSKFPECQLLTAERETLLRSAVDELTDSDREVIILKVFAGLTFDAIGEAIEQPAKTVATRYRRALLKLEEKLRGQL